jgi:hypothetical protein
MTSARKADGFLLRQQFQRLTKTQKAHVEKYAEAHKAALKAKHEINTPEYFAAVAAYVNDLKQRT